MDKKQLTNLSKQELQQADSKLGWLGAIYTLFITAMIAIGCKYGHWVIVGPILSLPISSILIIMTGLIPLNVHSGNAIAEQPANPFAYDSSMQFDSILDNSKQIPERTNGDILTTVNEKISKRKYRICKHSAWYILWIILPISKISEAVVEWRRKKVK